jgi:hypothetical protein
VPGGVRLIDVSGPPHGHVWVRAEFAQIRPSIHGLYDERRLHVAEPTKQGIVAKQIAEI